MADCQAVTLSHMVESAQRPYKGKVITEWPYGARYRCGSNAKNTIVREGKEFNVCNNHNRDTTCIIDDGAKPNHMLYAGQGEKFTLGVTGHRPNKLGGYAPDNPIRIWVKEQVTKFLEIRKAKYDLTVITGMALGFDQIVAEVCIELGIPFEAAIPFKGQHKVWPKAAQDHYTKLVNAASKVTIVSEGSYSRAKMDIRNHYIVDNSDGMYGCYNGTGGGTKNCLDYAKAQGKPIIILNPRDYNKG